MTIRGFFDALGLCGAIALLLLNRLLLAIGLRKRVDGWRHATGFALRGAESNFVLSAFGLQALSDVSHADIFSPKSAEEHIRKRLDAFLRTRRETWVRVRSLKYRDVVEPAGGPSYSLRFEPAVNGAERFVQPVVWSDGETHQTLLRFVCRCFENGQADLWVSVNHVGMDGLPVQTMLSELQSQWGVAEVVYPTPEEFEPFEQPRAVPGRAGIVELQAVIDFAPLIEWRRRQNKSLPQPMTISAAVQWCLSEHPALSDLSMGSTVEVGPVAGLASGVGVVVVRPEDYRHRKNGLFEYVRDFNAQVELTRRRQSDGAKTLDAAVFLPDRLTSILLRKALQGRRAFGTLGLTILKDAAVFGTPIGDAGHEDGFIAIGSVGLNTADGRKVGFLDVKGPVGRMESYPKLIREAIAQLSQVASEVGMVSAT